MPSDRSHCQDCALSAAVSGSALKYIQVSVLCILAVAVGYVSFSWLKALGLGSTSSNSGVQQVSNIFGSVFNIVYPGGRLSHTWESCIQCGE